MASVQRKRGGPSAPVKGMIDAGDEVHIGDLVGLSGGYVRPASELNNTAGFHDEFLGVLVEGATTGDETEDTPCLVETTGDFEYPLPSAAVATWPLGTYMGGSLSGGAIQNQVVDIANTSTEAVGKLARAVEVGDTNVLVRIQSVVMA